MPGPEWVNVATDVLMVLSPEAVVEMQTTPVNIGRSLIDLLRIPREHSAAILYFPTGLYQFSVSMEFSDSLTVLMGPEAVLLPDPGVTLTFRCSIRASLFQIFGNFTRPNVGPAQAGAIVFRGERMTELRPEWWGVRGKEEGDFSVPFNACIQAAHKDRLDVSGPFPHWDPPIPVVLSSHYFIAMPLKVGSFSVAGANPAPFVMRGEDAVGTSGEGEASISWNLPTPTLRDRVLLEIQGEVGAVIDNVHFDCNLFRATSCVRMNVGSNDPKILARAPGDISLFRRCTFKAGTKEAVHITTPVTPVSGEGAALDPLSRVVFDSCTLGSIESADVDVDIAATAEERVVLRITTSEMVGISLVGCGLHLATREPTIKALGGKLLLLSTTAHSFIIVGGVNAGNDVMLDSAPGIAPTTLVVIGGQSQSRLFLDRQDRVNLPRADAVTGSC